MSTCPALPKVRSLTGERRPLRDQVRRPTPTPRAVASPWGIPIQGMQQVVQSLIPGTCAGSRTRDDGVELHLLFLGGKLWLSVYVRGGDRHVLCVVILYAHVKSGISRVEHT